MTLPSLSRRSLLGGLAGGATGGLLGGTWLTSLAGDLGLGQPWEHSLRTCLVALRVGEAIALVSGSAGEPLWNPILQATGAEIVITTGGLGPTVDDPTREAVARAAGVETEFRQDLWEQVVAVIGRYGRKPSDNQRRQAYVPKGAIGIPNPVGTAPCFIVETERNAVISLPGVPNEMEHILHESVIPYLQKRFDLNEIIKIRVLHCAGLGEGMIDEKIADLETLSNPTVGLAAHTGVVDIRVAAKAESEAEADKMIADIEQQIRARLGDVVFGADEDRLEQSAAPGMAAWRTARERRRPQRRRTGRTPRNRGRFRRPRARKAGQRSSLLLR